ncbi:MAG: hypothetical protein MRY67_14270 [Rhodovulum sp.]|jgi:hypothetical protein|nr:hypothetical protein [Rhodovulum sp.]MCI5087083.1 hypothetical protein [Rhodovulum sp.]MEC8631459.1 hypothetical protein [Pseudomonadota bacterium]MEC8795794.1 hypothetical protein [Pseudomonadota bacterium]|tara:strand:- start:430 stop:720 length:291 start_codon:yes stop_codon:yes gene_type:complete
MKTRSLILGLALTALALPAQAACYADYKAKREKPLRLHYGVIELSDQSCTSRDAAAREISRKLEKDGWQLLNVMSTFAQDGLAERKSSAGKFYLKY